MNADLNTSLYGASPLSETVPINRDSPVPLHHQMRNYLLGCLERGELQPGQQLLQEREYASRFGISLAPVRQAILDLVKEGYFYRDRKSTRLNSSHANISYAVFCLKKKKQNAPHDPRPRPTQQVT